MKTTVKRNISFASVLFTYFVDNLGWAIVFPIFAPLFLDSQNLIFSADVATSTRMTILGIFLAAFPFGQFLGAPILGELADKYGRKNALVLSIILTFVGYLISGWSIHTKNLIWLFIGRIITGLFSGNLSVCLASISDLSLTEKTKARNFGLLSVLTGFSFILGAFLGGKFSDSTVVKFFNPALPLWMASLLSLVNLFFIIFAFKETIEIKKDVKFDLLEGIHNIRDALKTKNIKVTYVIYFLFVFAWTILFQFSPVLLIKKFSFSNSQIGNIAAFMGVCWAIGAGPVHKILSKRFSPIKILDVSLLVFTILCGFVGFPRQIIGVILLLGFCVIIGGLAWPLCATIISNKAPQKMQGKIMGMSQSMQSLAMVISPVVGGISEQLYVHLTFLIASLASFIAGLIYIRAKI